MKALALSFFTVTFVSLAFTTACGSKDDDKEETTVTPEYTYDDTQAIIQSNCATSGCHNTGSVNQGLTSLTEVKAMVASKMITSIQSSAMPKNDPDFKNRDEGKILLDWLAGGADLK